MAAPPAQYPYGTNHERLARLLSVRFEAGVPQVKSNVGRALPRSSGVGSRARRGADSGAFSTDAADGDSSATTPARIAAMSGPSSAVTLRSYAGEGPERRLLTSHKRTSNRSLSRRTTPSSASAAPAVVNSRARQSSRPAQLERPSALRVSANASRSSRWPTMYPPRNSASLAIAISVKLSDSRGSPSTTIRTASRPVASLHRACRAVPSHAMSDNAAIAPHFSWCTARSHSRRAGTRLPDIERRARRALRPCRKVGRDPLCRSLAPE